MVQVCHEGSALDKVLIVVKGVDDLQTIQDLGNKANNSTCGVGGEGV